MTEAAGATRQRAEETPAPAVRPAPAPAPDGPQWTPAPVALGGFGPALRRAIADGARNAISDQTAASVDGASTISGGSGMLVGRADDPTERAADQLADRALRRLAQYPAGGPPSGRPEALRRSTSPRSAGDRAGAIGAGGGELDARSASAIRRSRSAGSPLPAAVRGRMEAAFGQDLGGIRVHADGQATDLNATVSGRAVTEPAGVSRHLRRKLTKTAADVRGVRSMAGKLKGAATKDLLYQVEKALGDYSRLDAGKLGGDVKKQMSALMNIHVLCQAYLDTHQDHQDKAQWPKIKLIMEIDAEAEREHGQLRAQQRYLLDAYGSMDSGDPGGAPQASSTPLSKQRDTRKTHTGAKALGKGTSVEDTEGTLGAGATTLDLAQTAGLSEAEILAIRTYSADDFKYINPVTANNRDWLASKAPEVQDDPDAERQIKQEGALHAGMAVAGMQKLEVKQGPTYRGERLTMKDFEKRYQSGGRVVFPNITSTSLKEDVARGFTVDGSTDEHTVSVMCHLEVTNGRDIQQLSVAGPGESEWALLPGATFQVLDIQDEPGPHIKGFPKATDYKVVTLKQIR